MKKLKVPYEYQAGDRMICKLWASEEEREIVRAAANELGVRFDELFKMCFNEAVMSLLNK